MDSASKFQFGTVEDLFSHVADFGTINEMTKFVLICWSIWNGRNKVIFTGIKDSSEEILDRAYQMEINYHIIQHSPIEGTSQVSTIKFWNPPPIGVLKVNGDASVVQTSKHFNIGIVGRDSFGNVMFAEGRCLIGSLSPHLAELTAVKVGMEVVMKYGYFNWILESDAWSATNAIKSVAPFSDDALLVEPIKSLCNTASNPPLLHCSRFANCAAQDLAVYSRVNGCNVVFQDAIPWIIRNAAQTYE